MRILCLVLSLLILFSMVGCGNQNQIQTPVYTVTFSMGGVVCSEQQIPEGHLPHSVLTNVKGLQFVQWCTEDGKPINPYTVYVGKDIHYVAEAYPELTSHMPFLFLTEDGYIRPDDPLSADELSKALHALAAEGAETYFPGLPAGDIAVTWDVLIHILGSFFPPESIPAAPEDDEKSPVTRSEFAQLMCQLLGRGELETISMDRSVVLAHDITRNREDSIALMEASMFHTSGTGEHFWNQLQLPIQYEPGFVNVDGWLHYVKADYLYLKNGSVGTFRFDADGNYTSGNTMLDEAVADVLGQLIRENPAANRRSLLRLAFDWCSSYESVEKSSMPYGQTGWEVEEALTMLLDGKGDCYNYAAAFWALARGLGYDARVVSGKRGPDQTPHGWVIIEFDGEDYLFDPERQHVMSWQDRYMIDKEASISWRYTWDE